MCHTNMLRLAIGIHHNIHGSEGWNEGSDGYELGDEEWEARRWVVWDRGHEGRWMCQGKEYLVKIFPWGNQEIFPDF